MDRRSFLKSTSAAAAAATAATALTEQAGVAAPATAPAEPIRTALSGPFQHGYLRDRADRLARSLAELSDGRIRLAFVAVDGDVLTSLARGSTDAYFATEADHLHHHPALAYFSSLPGDLGLAPDLFATWLSSGGQMLWDDVAAEFSVKALAAGHSGRQPGLWSDRDITALSELSGRRVANYGLARRITTALGAHDVRDIHDVHDVLDATSAAADIVEPLMGPTAVLSEPAADRAYWFRDGFNGPGVVLSLGLSRRLWETFSDAHRALINSCTDQAYHQSLAEHAAHDQGVAPHLFAARNIRQRRLPNDVRRAITHISQEVIADTASHNETAAHIHESYMQFREIVTGLPDPLRTAAAV